MAAAGSAAVAWPQPVRLEEPAPEAPKPLADTPKPQLVPRPQEATKPLEVQAKPVARQGSTQGARRPGGSVNVDQEMLHLRRIFITGDINDDSAKAIVQQLLYLEAEDPSTPVTIFINSGGGLVHSGLAILDVMRTVSTPVKTVAYGRCFSIAALLLAAGTPGFRSAYSNARLMIHEPSCSYPKLQCTDIMIKADELRHTQRTLEELLSVQTGRSQAEIASAVQRDRYMSVAEAREFGIIDRVVLPAAAGVGIGTNVIAAGTGDEGSEASPCGASTPTAAAAPSPSEPPPIASRSAA